MSGPEELERVLGRLEALLARAEPLLPAAPPATDWAAHAYHWRRPALAGRAGEGYLEALPRHDPITLEQLLGVEKQKARLVQNTRQFVAGLPANNALLWGARGTGKSSLIKALLNAFAGDGLRLIEVERTDLVDLPAIVEQVAGRPERFIVYCDDLAFEAGDPAYRPLKVVLDGSLSATLDNVLVYASSNRRHLMPEYEAENEQTRYVGEEVHPGEAVEEKVALSDRFGLWLSFYPFNQPQYLEIVHHWLTVLGATVEDREALETEAVRWATARGGRSGRIAYQFARDVAGRQQLDAGG